MPSADLKKGNDGCGPKDGERESSDEPGTAHLCPSVREVVNIAAHHSTSVSPPAGVNVSPQILTKS